ncbi:ABC transporter permease [Halocella sp. SP3-1]|uniref:ABC transporter permease n=1 Tax=Halocella sp. SP3-1 TaxID=2382161 RepID=UPI000F74D970|nr:ABC transporter permease [Halocella sp. SP3-1]AZO93134.1 ABC transporter permease [Halocella sp. SP3-1]
MKKKFEQIVPFIGLLILLILFSLIIGGKFWKTNNLLAIFNQTVLIMIGGLGMIFVVAQGSVDISQGSTLALVATLTGIVVNNYGLLAIIPTVLLVGGLVGLINGVVVSKFKVSSLTCTLGLLIAIRALVAVLCQGTVIYIPFELFAFSNFNILFPTFIGLIIIIAYFFEYTKMGYYSKIIGANEVKAQYSGVPVGKMKILAFIISGIMAGVAGVFTLSRIGGVDPGMGNFFELQVLLALFAGGIPVTGGTSSKIYKLFIGSLIVGILENGLTLASVSGVLAEGIKGIVLIMVVFITMYHTNSQMREKTI